MTSSFSPPPELVSEWAALLEHCTDAEVFTAAAQWGADMELEACLVEVSFLGRASLASKVRDARRPKPPSLKEQALQRLPLNLSEETVLYHDDIDIIRQALEALDD